MYKLKILGLKKKRYKNVTLLIYLFIRLTIQ
jgi:hypothetical protein